MPTRWTVNGPNDDSSLSHVRIAYRNIPADNGRSSIEATGAELAA